MIINKMFKLILSSFFLYITITVNLLGDQGFKIWSNQFQDQAINAGISEKVVREVMSKAKFLPKVIEYDRYQPEFYEDTFTYIKKRSSNRKLKEGLKLYNKEKNIIESIEKDFHVEKELLLALMGIETNFGKYLGKMDIVSSLATLSYDKRRSEFFTEELIILLKLVDKNIIDPKTLYGSWAGAFGNFQFMPSTIKNYAIDYDNNNKIELKNSLKDAVASAANYINKIGWKFNEPCFYRVNLTRDISKKYINTSARTISNRLKIKKWIDKGIISHDGSVLESNLKAALILPDGSTDGPAYLVFRNYEKVLQWNRSLRFGISVCTLSNMIKA